MAAKSDYYDILGVTKTASEADLKKAYRKQAVEWHPDKHQDNKEAAEKRFKEINEAYQILSDKDKRSAYDQYGHSAFSPGGMPGGGAGFPGGSPFGGGNGGAWKVYTSGSGGQQGFSGFDFGDPFDVFEQFFGGGNPFRRAQQIPRYSVTIEFMEAIKGVEKKVKIGDKERKIKIPAGVNEGSRIRFEDFILSIDVKPHELFERDGADIFVNILIPYSMAVNGGKVEVPTVDKKVKIKVRSGTRSGTMVRLRGKGVPRVQGRGNGDQYVRLQIMVPEKPTGSQKKVIKALEEEGL